MSETRLISFPNGRMARCVEHGAGRDVAEAIDALGLGVPNAVLLVAGDATALDRAKLSQLTQLFSRGFARAALTTGALIIDDGSAGGVAALVGQAIADRGSRNVVLGVGRAGATTSSLDENHTHFVLGAGDRRALAIEIAHRFGEATSDEDDVPVVLLVVGGGSDTRGLVLRAVRRGTPVLVIAGTGGLADEVTAAVAQGAGFIEDPELAEIVADGEIHMRKIEDDVREFEHQVAGLCEEGGDDLLLRFAWGQLGRYDKAAGDYQKRFRKQQNRILALGVVAVLLVVIQAQIWATRPEPSPPPTEQATAIAAAPLTGTTAPATRTTQPTVGTTAPVTRTTEPTTGTTAPVTRTTQPVTPTTPPATPAQELEKRSKYLQPFGGGAEMILFNILHLLIVLAPIATAIMVGLANRMNPGLKQILLRAAAESVKREIYRYRARSAEYSDAATSAAGTSRSRVLATRLKGVNETLMSTQANEAALPPYKGPIPPKYTAAEDDDGLSPLTAARYIKQRLVDQRSFYESKSRRLEASRYRLHAAILVVGGAGTLLAAINYELWVTLTTALAAAFAAYMEYQQIEATLVSYNQAKSNLYDVEAWWLGLSASERGDPERFTDLVETTEKVLGTEQVAWVQNMQDALAELRRDPTGQGLPEPAKKAAAEAAPTAAPTAPAPGTAAPTATEAPAKPAGTDGATPGKTQSPPAETGTPPSAPSG